VLVVVKEVCLETQEEVSKIQSAYDEGALKKKKPKEKNTLPSFPIKSCHLTQYWCTH